MTRSAQYTPPYAGQAAVDVVDAAIVGAGPAGCAAALWLSELGFQVALIEQADQLLPRLQRLDLAQNWVLGEPGVRLSDLAQRYAAHIRSQPRVRMLLRATLAQAWAPAPGEHWRLQIEAGRCIAARAVVVATGLRPVGFESSIGPKPPLTADELTRQRIHWLPGRVLLLGGGDNAVENAIWLARAGHVVTLWSRGPLRAQRYLRTQLADLPPGHLILREAEPMPLTITSRATAGAAGADNGWEVRSAAHGMERFDQVAALFGNEPDNTTLELLARAAGSRAALSAAGVFVAGDLGGRWHPCVSTAIADGVQVAKTVQHWLDRSTAPPETAAPTTTAPANGLGQQTLNLTGLRFDANLGILAHEKNAPQPIQVDAELHLGLQPLAPRDDHIHNVLDYRRVRQIIIDECTAEHVNLLESLIGKLARRLLQLPGVLGVRVKIAKLEIFADCEVAIRVETGQW